ncbi:MAG: PEP-CTERM sorting domain-containing protein [Planctomycetota bacterium]|jgi:hypothetical protein
MMDVNIVRLLSVSLALLAIGATAHAGILATDDDALSAFQGTTNFYGSLFTFVTDADVDYAVYAPGTFDAAMAEALPGLYYYGAGGIRDELDLIDPYYHVYAYQIFALTGDNVTQMTVGLDADEVLGHIGFLAGTGDVDPTGSAFYGAPPTSARWDFAGVAPGQASQIVFFASAGQPEWDSSTVKGFASATVSLPSPDDQPPAPEPGTLALLAAGSLAVLRRRRGATV